METIAVRFGARCRRKRSGEALQASEMRFQALTENSMDVIGIFDAEGRAMYGSPSVTRVLGWGPTELNGQIVFDYVHPEDRARVYGEFLRAVRCGDTTDIRERFRFRHKDGSWRTFEAVVSNLLEVPAVRGIVITSRDVTEHERADARLRSQERQLQAIVGAVNDVVLELDGDGRYLNVWASDQTELARPREELLGRRIDDVLPADEARQFAEPVQRVLRTGVPEKLEYPLTLADGEHWFLATLTRLSGLDGGPDTICMGITNVTDRKRAEQALARSEALFRALTENASDMITVVDPDGLVLYESPSVARQNARPPEQVIGRPVFERIHPDDLAEVSGAFRRVAQDPRNVVSLRYRFRHRDGAWHVFETIGRNLLDDPAVHGIVLNTRDVSEQARAAEALKASETRFRALTENSMDLIAIFDAKGRLSYASPSAQRILGYKPGVLLGEVGFHYVHPDDVTPVREAFGRAAASRDTTALREQFRFRHVDGSWRSFEAVVSNLLDVPAVRGIVVNCRDVTERARAEEALRESEARLRSLFAGINDAIFVHDEAGQILDCNEAACRRLGYSRAELLRMHTSEIDAPGFARGYDARLAAQIQRGQFSCEGAHLTKGGRRIPVDISTTVIEYYGKRAVLAVMRDITRRKQTEAALRRSEAEFRGLVERAPLGIYRATRDGRFLMVNPALVRTLGYDSAEEVARLSIPRDVCMDPTQWEQTGGGGSTVAEVRWKRRDGTQIVVRISSRLFPNAGDGDAFSEALVEDVTEVRSLENQFRQAQRLEAVGRLAGGVAHDFNNVLTAITGYSELVLSDLAPDDPKRGDVEEIRAAGHRAAALTRQLLAFSRRQVLHVEVLDLNAVVRTLDRMLRRLIGEDVTLELALSDGLGAVRADPAQMEQVLMNLAVNARDAMPIGGRLTIATANVVLDESYARAHPGAQPGRHVLLAVSDTGVGMDPETQLHIFEPFFTTKEAGKGTGLGLATVHGIVTQSGGNICVDSERGRGATFRLYFPRVDAQPGGASDTPTPWPAGGSETVLLAEDDASVRGVMAHTLEQQGYQVLPALDGQAALELARAHHARIHLLVTDLVMPGMTGRELAAVLSAERPDLRVIYISGYPDDAVVRHGVLEKGLQYLQKPLAAVDLARKVREVLDAPPGKSRAGKGHARMGRRRDP